MLQNMLWSRIVPTGGGFLALVSLKQSALCYEKCEDPTDAELKLVQVVFRHGARTPLTDRYWGDAKWEKDKDCTAIYKAVQLSLTAADGGAPPESKYDQKQMATMWAGGCSKGELTVAGQIQARDLGQWLRQRYIRRFKLLPESFQVGTMAAQTTNYSRTRATLQGVITGLYPDFAQRVPVLTSGDMDEILIGTPQSCSHLSSLLKLQALRLREQIGKDAGVSKLDEEVRGVMQLGPEERIAYTDLYDALTTLKHHGKGWPPGMSEQLYRRIEGEALKRMAAIVSPSATDELAAAILSLSVGQLFGKLLGAMEEVVEGGEPAVGPRMVLLSGHDTTVMPLLVSLTGHDLGHWPPYLANVVIELWQKKGAGSGEESYFVRAFYNQEEMDLSKASPGHYMNFKTFREKHWLPYKLARGDYVSLCKAEMQHEAPTQAAALGGDSIQGL